MLRLGWVAWCYLWLPAWQWGHEVLTHGLQIDADESSGGLITLVIYTMIGLTLGTALVVWAMSSYYKYKGVDRRKSRGDTRPEDVACQLGISLDVLRFGQDQRLLVVHHQPDGGIDRVQSLS